MNQLCKPHHWSIPEKKNNRQWGGGGGGRGEGTVEENPSLNGTKLAILLPMR